MDLGRFNQLKEAFEKQLEEIRGEVEERKSKLISFYKNSNLGKFIISYGQFLDSAKEKVRNFFGKDKINLVAIDGSVFSIRSKYCLCFWVGSCSVSVQIDIDSDTYKFTDSDTYEEEVEYTEPNFVGIIPVAYSQIGDEGIEKVDNFLMTLAEIYMAYKFIKKDIKPDVLLLYGSLLFSFDKHTNFEWGRGENPFVEFEKIKKDKNKIFNDFKDIEKNLGTWNAICKSILEDSIIPQNFIFSDPKISYLIGVGLIAILQSYYELINSGKRIIIASISKRSFSRSFFDKFLEKVITSDFSKFKDLINQPDAINMFWLIDGLKEESLKHPIFTVDYDGVFEKIDGESPIIPGLILRSYCQIKGVSNPHILAIDRLAFQDEKEKMKRFDGGAFYYNGRNDIQEILAFLFHTLCPEKTPITVGYPEPLLLADRRLQIEKNFYSKIPELIFLDDELSKEDLPEEKSKRR